MESEENKITAILQQERRRTRVNIFLKGSYAFSLHRLVATDAGLRAGFVLSEEDIISLQRKDAFFTAQDAAYKFLSYRPRSEAEVRNKLLRRGCSQEDVDSVISRLKEKALLDDEAFAHYWREQYGERRLRGKGLVKAELRRKGIDKETVDRVTEDMNDAEGAYAAGAKRAKTMKYTGYSDFRKRLGNYLVGRGFKYESVNSAIRSLWGEIQEDHGSDERNSR